MSIVDVYLAMLTSWSPVETLDPAIDRMVGAVKQDHRVSQVWQDFEMEAPVGTD